MCFWFNSTEIIAAAVGDDVCFVCVALVGMFCVILVHRCEDKYRRYKATTCEKRVAKLKVERDIKY